MTRPSRSSVFAGLAVVAGLFALAVWLQTLRDGRYALDTSDEETLYLSQRATGRVVFTQRPLASDLYWIRAIQYFGGRTKDAKERFDDALEPPPALAQKTPVTFDLLYPLLDITTSLDPRFNIAYRFGAVFLAEPYPNGPGRPDLAIKLLEKGLGDRPDKWEYMQDAGFVNYWYRHDYKAAAAWFERASVTPGAPWWLKSLAATTLAEGGDRESSRVMWQAILQSAEIDWLRRDAQRRLLQLRALDQLDSLQAAVDRFTKAAGNPPATWAPVIAAEKWPGTPVDPTGASYVLTPDGRVHLAPASSLFPLPVEPDRLSPAS